MSDRALQIVVAIAWRFMVAAHLMAFLALTFPVYGQHGRPTAAPPTVPFQHAPGPWISTILTVPQQAACSGGIAYYAPFRVVLTFDADTADNRAQAAEFKGAPVETTKAGMCDGSGTVALPVRLVGVPVTFPRWLANGMTFNAGSAPGEPQQLCGKLSAWNVGGAVPEPVHVNVPICGALGSKAAADLWPWGQFAKGQ